MLLKQSFLTKIQQNASRVHLNVSSITQNHIEIPLQREKKKQDNFYGNLMAGLQS